MIGSQDLIVGLVLVLVLFGAKKLPELAGSIGKSMKEFKKGVSQATEEEPVKAADPALNPASKQKVWVLPSPPRAGLAALPSLRGCRAFRLEQRLATLVHA